MSKLLYAIALFFCFLTQAKAQIEGWDTLEFRAPLSQINLSLRSNERLLAAHENGISYTDNYGDTWQNVQNAPKNAYSIWLSEGKIYASSLKNGNDTTWVSTDNGLTFGSWDAYTLSSPAFKVIQQDTMVLAIRGNNQVFRRTKGGTVLEEIFIHPGTHYALQLTSIGNRLLLLSTDGIRWSDNGGLNWTLSGASIPINNLCLDCDRIVEHEGVLFFHNRSNVLLRSDDAGETWESLSFFQQNPNVLLRYVISEGNDLLAATYNHVFPETDPQVWRSSDLGNTWNTAYPEIFGDEFFLASYPSMVGKRLMTNKGCYAVSNNDSVWETRNAGLPKVPMQTAVRLPSGAWVVAVLNRLFRTENEGQTYKMVYLNKYNHFGSIERFEHTLVATPPDSYGLLRSEDEGLSWQVDSVPGETFIYKHCRENAESLLVLFASGKLYRYSVLTAAWEYLSDMGLANYLASNNGVLYTEGPNGVRVSTDFGNTFTLLTADFPPFFECGPIYSCGNSVLISSLGFEIYQTNDQGLHWTLADLANGSPFLIRFGDVANDGDALAAYTLYGGVIYFSDDRGLQWYESNVPIQSFGPVTISYLKQFDGVLYVNFMFGGKQYFIRKQLHGLSIDKLKGRVFQDSNLNAVQDPGETGMPNVILNGAGFSNDAITDQNGDYTLVFRGPSDTIVPIPPFIHYVAAPEKQIVTSPADSIDFAVNTQFQDLELHIGSGSQPRPGFEQVVSINVFNAGITAEKCVVKAIFDPLYSIIETTPPATSSGGTLIWMFDSLAPYTFQNIDIKCSIPSTAPIGMPVVISAAVIALSNPDDFPDNNHDTLAALIVGAYDPNDKTALTGNKVLQSDLEAGKRLEYQIRFQNTGNFPASFVRILDTLSADFVPHTFKLEATSHPVHVRFAGPRILDFFFPQINLPDSASNEAESHGFLRFSIEAQRNLSIGDSIRNRAAIYFDFNPPVITNEPVTLVSSSLGTSGDKNAEPIALKISPNPASAYSWLTIRLPDWIPGNTPINVRTFDTSGRLLRQDATLSLGNMLLLEGLPKGEYTLFVSVENRVGVGILLVK